MKISRSQEQWQTIIEDQQPNGLTIFVPAKITQQVELIEEQTIKTVTVGKINLSLPASISVTYVS